MILLDSSYYIAIVDKRDQWHQKALELSNYFENKDIVVSSFIISEVLTEIGNRSGGKVAYNLYNYFDDANGREKVVGGAVRVNCKKSRKSISPIAPPN